VQVTQDALTLARTLAGELVRACPEELWRVPIRVSRVARYLGYPVEVRADLPVRARLDPGTRIILRRDIAPEVGRFALAHEIAHAYLHERHPQVALSWSVPRNERFANFFAAELLIPASDRAFARERLSGATNVRDVLTVARHFGLTTTCLLTFAARQETWFHGLDLLVLRIKHAENRRTKREPRLRVAAAYFDSERFYLPSNQSIATLAGDDEWLTRMRPGETVSCERSIILSLRTPKGPLKWRRASVSTHMNVLRLKEAAHDGVSQYLALARVLSSDLVPSE
jgi:hypothetical protein